MAPTNFNFASKTVARIKTRGALLSIGFLALSLASTPCRAGDVVISTQAASDWMYHGTTETGGNPVVGVALDWEVSRHSFVGIEAHQAEVENRPQRHRSVMIYAGTGRALNDAWYGTISVSHREYPKSVKEWDFTEFAIRLDNKKGWGIALDYSPRYYEHNTASFSLEVKYRRELGERVYAYASAGALELSNSAFTDYQYGRIGAGVRFGRAVFDLAYAANSKGPASEFGAAPLSSARFVGSLTWRLW